MMSEQFACSPAFFDDSVESDWIKNLAGEVFPQFQSIDGMERIMRMCLASLINHVEKVMSFDPNHVARTIPIFRDSTKIATVLDKVKIVRAWDSNDRVLTGAHQGTSGVGSFTKRLCTTYR